MQQDSVYRLSLISRITMDPSFDVQIRLNILCNMRRESSAVQSTHVGTFQNVAVAVHDRAVSSPQSSVTMYEVL